MGFDVTASYATVVDGHRHVWEVPRLWELSRDLPTFDYPVTDFDGMDLDCWYGRVHVPTVRSVLTHMKRIERADLTHPIILSQSGAVMDGVHRICRAWLAEQATVLAVRFTIDPPPDRVEPYPPT